MKESFLKLTSGIIFNLIAATAIILPLFFVPATTEFFEYNKFAALLFLSIVGFVVWSIKMILEKRTVITRTPLDVPLIVLLGIYFISSYSSLDQFISFYGAHGRVWPSFAPLAVIAAIYFLTVSNLKNRKQVNLTMWIFVFAGTVASLIALSSYFGGFLPYDFTQIRSFNTVGVINKLAILQGLIIPIAISWAIYEKDKTSRAIATGCTLVMAASFILINFMPAYIGVVVSIAFLSIGTLRVKLTKTQQGHAAILAVVILLFLVIRFVPQVAQGTLYQWIIKKDQGVTEQQQIDTPKEKNLPFAAGWDIAAQAIGKRPVFGTGPGTFQFVYTQLKPRNLNEGDNWAVRYDKSSSEFMEIVATVGILGVLAYLLVLVATIRFIWTLIFKSQNTIVYLPLAASILGYIVASAFTVGSFATTATFFILISLLSVLAKTMNEDNVFDVTFEVSSLKNRFAWLPFGMPGEDQLIKTEAGSKGAKSQILPIIFTILVVVTSIFVLNYQIKAYRADYFYRQSLLASRSNNDGNKVVEYLQKAIATNPQIDTYHRVFSQTVLNAAINLSQQKNLSEEQKQLLGQLAQVAIDQGKAASGYQILPLRLPGISSANVSNWETLSAAYQALIGAVQGADVHATNTLAQAIALDPQNAILHNRLGSLYERLGNLDLAQRKYEDAVIVKGDFGPAHYSLANILIAKKGEVPRIVNELALAKRFLPKEDPATDDIAKKLDQYNKELTDLQEKAAQQQKEAQAEQKTNASPTPSPSISPTPKAEIPEPVLPSTSPAASPGL